MRFLKRLVLMVCLVLPLCFVSVLAVNCKKCKKEYTETESPTHEKHGFCSWTCCCSWESLTLMNCKGCRRLYGENLKPNQIQQDYGFCFDCRLRSKSTEIRQWESRNAKRCATCGGLCFFQVSNDPYPVFLGRSQQTERVGLKNYHSSYEIGGTKYFCSLPCYTAHNRQCTAMGDRYKKVCKTCGSLRPGSVNYGDMRYDKYDREGYRKEQCGACYIRHMMSFCEQQGDREGADTYREHLRDHLLRKK